MSFQQIENWYKRADVRFKILENIKNRELAFIVPTWCDKEIQKRSRRNHSIGHISQFGFLFDYIGFFKQQTPYNLYMSVARYENGIPKLPYSNKFKRDQMKKDWEENHWKKIEHYDFYIDVDSPTHSEYDMKLAHYSAMKIKKALQQRGMKFNIIFSGCGFHFRILMPQDTMDYNPHNDNNIYQFFRDMSQELYDNVSEFVDLKIYDSRRLIKIPFSLAVYEFDLFVCYPFESDIEFYNFKLDDYRIENFNKKIREHKEYVFY